MAEDILTTDDGQEIVSDGTGVPIRVDGASAWVAEVVKSTGSIDDVLASAIALMDRLVSRIDAATNFARLMGATPQQLAPVTRFASALVENRTQLARAVLANTGRE